ncbi:CRTAC1 family protein [Sanyastnella coralliicola]|uniref:CRTAC1 family protein n=1 Tax=Sanyastnella coralliicola TaxID=3069118 RepID=UPI0027B9980A|nr:CRTAC1 family protein [Longitalea sp. SCSIO 12813]
MRALTMMKKTLILALACVASSVIVGQEAVFSDVSEGANITGEGINYGLSVVDINEDGLDDFYVSIKNSPNKLYQNNADGTYTDVAPQLGLDDAGNTYASIWADFDNDGDKDLYCGNYNGPNSFYRNMGNGLFVEGAEALGIADEGQCRCVITGDVNNDGWLDIYVVNINQANAFYLGHSGGFTDHYVASGAFDNLVGMGAVFFDSDNDGDVDLYLTHDAYQPNRLYINNGSGVFNNQGFQLGAAHSGEGMGVDVTDYDHDGWLDIYITNNYDGNALLRNDGDGSFTNVEEELEVDDPGMGWGVAWFDYNLDGEKDLYMANNYNFSTFPNRLFRNVGDGTFAITGDDGVIDSPWSSAAIAITDADNDGDEDILVANSLFGDSPGVQLFENNSETGNYIGLRFEGTVSNRDAFGSRVTLWSDGHMQVDEHLGASGYSQQNSDRMVFGLGERQTVDSLIIRWPNGLVEEFYDLEINTEHYFVEGQTLEDADADLNNDLTGSVIDLLNFLSNYGCSGPDCEGDLDDDDDVDTYDLLLALTNLFGP